MTIKSSKHKNKMQQDRFNKMRELSVLLNRELVELDYWNFDSTSMGSPLHFVEQRIAKLPLRAFFVNQLFALLRQEVKLPQKVKLLFSSRTEDFSVKLPFVFEIVISIQYLHNQILDQKAGVVSSDKINNNLLQANILKDMLYQYIDNNFGPKEAQMIRQAVRKAFVLVDYGQQLEKQYGTIQQFQKGAAFEQPIIPERIDNEIDFAPIQEILDLLQQEIPLNYWSFTHLYLKRIFLTCGALFKISTELIADLLGITGEAKKLLIDFASSYGMMRQIINDNADFTPSHLGLSSTGKTASDTFSDLKNNNITLPMILHLVEHQNDSIIPALIQQPQMFTDSSVQNQVATELLDSTALFKSVWVARHFAAIAQRFLPNNNANADLLANTCDIAYWNKFLVPITKTKKYKAFKKTAAYRQLATIERNLQNNPTPIPLAQQTITLPAYLYQLQLDW